MKRFLFLFVIGLIPLCVCSQTNEGQLSMYAVIANDNLPDKAAQSLTNKLTRIISSNGYGSLNEAERFVLVANIDVTGNDVIPSTPARVSKKISITLIIGDIIENKTFGSCCVNVAGIGTNDNKAFISAFSQLNTSDNSIIGLFEESKNKITEYYSNVDMFLTKAHAFTNTGEYDRAIAYLMTIPPIDPSTFSVCEKEIGVIFQEKIDKEGLVLFNQASGIWKSNRNLSGAKQAATILQGIDPYSSVMPQVDVLWNDISKKLAAIELAEIEAAKRAHEERMQQAEITAENTRLLIDAAKAVGIAFGIFQPRIVVNRIVRRWF